MTKMNCPLCNQEIDTWPQGNYRIHECPCCGWFILRSFPHMDIALIRNETASYFYYTGNRSFLKRDTTRTNFVGDKDFFDNDDLIQRRTDAFFITKEEILAFYPRTFSERINKILLGLARQIKYIGNSVPLTENELVSAFFVKRFNENCELLPDKMIRAQLLEIQNYLAQNKLIKLGYKNNEGRIPVTLLLDGWQRIDELQKNNPDNRDVFIAMSFRTENDKIREAIKEGIVRAGYSPEFMDEIIHNQQIVPEMFRLIREAKLLILEISDPNYGSYLEAGYAMALGKEVIVCCKQEVFDKKYETEEEKKYERYLKPHFDIVQKQILKWDNPDDLANKLSEWIKAIAG